MQYRFTLLLTVLLSLFVFAAAAQPCAEQDTVFVPVGICTGETYVYDGQTINQPGEYYFTYVGSNGCDSVVLLFVVDFHFSITELSICEGDSVLWGGEWRYTNDFYADTISSGTGCDSIAFLDLGVRPPVYGSDTALVCFGDSVFVNGQWYKNGDAYNITLGTGNGCDSIVTYQVVNRPLNNPISFSETICLGDSVFFGGSWRKDAGLYSESYTGQYGCDSLVYLKLFTINGYFATDTASICLGDSFLWRGQYYYIPSTVSDTVSFGAACDSIYTLLLTVYPSYAIHDTVTICQGSYVIFGGQPVSTAGYYTQTHTTSSGCDSTRTLQLYVNPVYQSLLHDTICRGSAYSFYGNILTDSGTYYATFIASGGCDSVIALNLHVKDSSITVINATACSNVGYNFYGNVLTGTGLYFHTLQKTNGCDSTIELHLTINPAYEFFNTVSLCQGSTYNFLGQPITTAGSYTQAFTTAQGCDSIYHLQLQVIAIDTTILAASICNGQQYNFDGTILNTAGTYYHTYASSKGCDSVVELHLAVNSGSISTLQATICSGQQYNFNGNLLSNTGTYTQTLTAVNGCDSVVTLQLTVVQPVTIPQQATICSGQQYSFYGSILTASGNYTHIISQGTGCDTTITLQLTVTDTLFTYTTASVCSGQSYNFYGNLLTTAGTYEQYFTTTTGCDSVVVLVLTLHPTFNITSQLSICQGQSVNFFGTALSAAGTYTHNGTTINGCDSVVTLQLTVADTFKTILNQNACYDGFYNFYGQQLSTTGVYYTTLQSSGGCDSLLELHLTIDTQIVTHTYATICSNTSYNFFGTTYNTPGIYGFALVSSAGCDSIVRLHLSVNQPSAITNLTAQICSGNSYAFAGNLLTQAGSYTHTYLNSVGCDSVVNLTLTVNDSAVTNQQAFICLGDTFDFYGTPLWFSGLFNHYFTTTAGCDSVIRLNLGVLATPLTSVSESICKGSSYSFFGSVLTQAGVYQHKIPVGGQCDSVIELTLTLKDTLATATSASICANQSYNFYGTLLTAAGSYSQVLASSNGCDSTVYLTLSVNPVLQQTIDTSILSGSNYTLPGGGVVSTAGTYKDTLSSVAGCDSIVITNLSVIIGLKNIAVGHSYSVFPNPVNEQLNVYIDALESSRATIALTDLSGRVVQSVFEGELTLGKNEWLLSVSDLAAGTYLLYINEQKIRVAVVH